MSLRDTMMAALDEIEAEAADAKNRSSHLEAKTWTAAGNLVRNALGLPSVEVPTKDVAESLDKGNFSGPPPPQPGADEDGFGGDAPEPAEPPHAPPADSDPDDPGAPDPKPDKPSKTK